MPEKAGIQKYQLVTVALDPGACPGPDPGFAGVTTSYDAVIRDYRMPPTTDGKTWRLKRTGCGQ